MNHFKKYLSEKLKSVGDVDRVTFGKLLAADMARVDEHLESLARCGRICISDGGARLSPPRSSSPHSVPRMDGWLGRVLTNKKDEILRRAAIAPVNLKNLGGVDAYQMQYWEVYRALREIGQLVECDPPTLSRQDDASRQWTVARGYAHIQYPFDFIDTKILVYAMKKPVTSRALYCSEIKLRPVNERLKRLEADGFLKQTYSTEGHNGNFRPRWYRATDAAKAALDRDYDAVETNLEEEL